MSDRWRSLLGEVWRFFAVAQAATWVSFLLFNIALHGWLIGDPLFPDQAILVYVIANSIGMIISYHGARGWGFEVSHFGLPQHPAAPPPPPLPA